MKLIKVDLIDTLIIGDVHSSPEKLKTVLSASNASKFLFLGDLVDRGSDPNEVIDIVHDLKQQGKATVLMGNHDWKFIRWFNGQRKVSMKAEQELTLKQLTDTSIERFNLIFEDLIVGAWDAKEKVLLSHAAAGRPYVQFKKSAVRLSQELGEDFSPEDLIQMDSINLSKKIGNIFLFGVTNSGKVDEKGFPIRLPITESPDDDLDGWMCIHGHIHAKNLFPENGNKNVVCLDWACGEEGGKLGSIHYQGRDSISVDKVIFSK